MTGRTRLWLGAGALAVVLVAVAVIVYISNTGSPLPAPAQTVESVLELRYDRSTDASAYAPYFEEVSVAEALAQDASSTVEATSSAQPPIPRWERPYLSALDTGTADVVVVWKSDSRFEEWATATIFKMKKLSGLWKIADAQELTSTAPPALE